MKKILILILILLNSCGYQPLYIDKKNTNIKFNEISFEGNQNLGRELSSRLFLEEITSDKKLDKLIIKSKIGKLEASKNSKGHVTAYRIFVEVNLIIEDKENKKIRDKLFTKDFIYNVDDDKFKSSEYQREIENNLINQIVEEAILYFSL
tara:strand:+ start:767 stop:1216 length:450 start_codon:yes stop_codon:yes gene_type:complete